MLVMEKVIRKMEPAISDKLFIETQYLNPESKTLTIRQKESILLRCKLDLAYFMRLTLDINQT